MNEEQEVRSAPMSNQKRTALLRYMMILFAVAFLLVLLSYLIQVFNSQNTISQLNATSASALQNAERLQDTNRELTDENERLKSELDEALEQNQAIQRDAETSRTAAEAQGRAEGEEAGRQAGIGEAQKAYDLLLKAATSADEAERTKAIHALNGMEDILSESAKKQLELLKTPAVPNEQPAEGSETNQPTEENQP